MSIYELPAIKPPTFFKSRTLRLVVLVIVISSLFGFLAGAFSGSIFYWQIRDSLAKLNIKLPEASGSPVETVSDYQPQTSQEEAVINVVKDFSPAVVSIVITKDVPIIEQYYINPFPEFFGEPFQIPQYRQKGTEKQEVGGGSGFIVSEDGMVLTNKHVVLEEAADYTVFTNDGKSYPAKVLARDPVQDLAILKIENETGAGFPMVKFGDSDKLQSGQTVVAIGNALGEFKNTVSTGVVSGLGRKITASGGGLVETLEDVIQTDAAINRGNSGGPLLNLKGEVIGINTAMVEGAQSVGFAIPANKAKRAIEQVKQTGKIVYPFLGVRYVVIDAKVKSGKNLTVDYGALVGKGDNGEAAIFPGSAAEKAGLKEGDIILEFDGEKITVENSLSKIIMEHNPGDSIILKILSGGQEKNIQLLLGERNE